MRTKNLILILIVILAIIAIALGSYFLFFNNTEYKNITMDGITFEVKNSTANVSDKTDNFYMYNDTENNITILLFDSEGMGFNDFGEATEFALTRDAMQMENTPVDSDNYTYNKSTKFDRYTYLTNYTHKNLFVITQNKDDMEHILSTIKEDKTLNQSAENQTNNTTEVSSQKTTTKKSSSNSQESTQREEDKITPDGWNPKEHETSREDMGDGYQKVHYDDGYFRVVDKKGNIQTYGYGG